MSFKTKLKKLLNVLTSTHSLPKERYLLVTPPDDKEWELKEIRSALLSLSIRFSVKKLRNNKKSFLLKTIDDTPEQFEYMNQHWTITTIPPRPKVAICFFSNLPIIHARQIVENMSQLFGKIKEIREYKTEEDVIHSISVSFSELTCKEVIKIKKLSAEDKCNITVKWRPFTIKNIHLFIKKEQPSHNKPRKMNNSKLIWVPKQKSNEMTPPNPPVPAPVDSDTEMPDATTNQPVPVSQHSATPPYKPPRKTPKLNTPQTIHTKSRRIDDSTR